MAQIDREVDCKLRGFNPINDKIKKVISIKPSLIDRWSIWWSVDRIGKWARSVQRWLRNNEWIIWVSSNLESNPLKSYNVLEF